MGLSRDEVYICNILKCRPPNNRDPLPDEIEQCEPYLKRQIEIVQPRVICTLGRFAAQTLLRSSEPMGRLRDQSTTTRAFPWWLRTTRRPSCATPSGSARLGKT